MNKGRWWAFVCPDCGGRHVVWVPFDDDLGLSVDAQRILDAAPRGWKRGEPRAIQLLADLSGMSYRKARAALVELNDMGYVATIPFGKRGVRYVGVFSMISRVERKRAA